MLADIICHWKMMLFMMLDDVKWFLRLNNVTNTCKRMGHSLSIGWSSSVQWRRDGRN